MEVDRLLDSFCARFIGTKHGRDVKRKQPLVDAINPLEREMKLLTDAELTARTAKLRAEVQARLEGVEDNDPQIKVKLAEALEAAVGPVFGGARGGAADDWDAAFRLAVDRRNCAAPGQNFGNEDGRGQDAGGHAAGVFE